MKKKRILLIAAGIILLLGIALWAIFLRPTRPVVSVAERMAAGEDDTRTLIVVYSYSGNTRRAAQRLQELTGGDLLEINTRRDYPDGMAAVSAQTRMERATGLLPALDVELPDLAGYDRVLIGGPVWSYATATPLSRFLSGMDFTGTQVAPFWTDAGSPGDYEADFGAQVRGGELLPGLGLSNLSRLSDAEIIQRLEEWLTLLAEPASGGGRLPAGAQPTPNQAQRPAIDRAGGYTVETQELFAENEGQQIYGLLYRPVEAEGPRPVVIYAHGFGSSYRNGEQYARALAAQGYLAYCFDFLGGSESSRSEGSNLEMSIFTEQSDLEAVIAMLKGRSDVDSRNIFLLGASQGGMVSAMTAADNEADIAGAVLLYPAFVLIDDARERFSDIDEVPETYRHMFMTVGRPYFEKLFDYDVYNHIQAYSRDILLIHGDRDGIVPLSYSERALEVYPSARLEAISGAGHGFHGGDAQQAIDWMSDYFSLHLNP